MASGSSPNSRANLALATGGDRYAGKRAMIEVIRLALLESMTDAEIRRFWGLKRGETLSAARRNRAAAAKSKQVYQAIIDGWTAGLKTDLNGLKLVNIGGAWVQEKTNGISIGGIVRLGMGKPKKINLQAYDDYGETLESQGIQIFRRPTYDAGNYAVLAFADATSRPVYLSRGWFSPWWAAGGTALFFGPTEVTADGRFMAPSFNGTMSAFGGEYLRMGWKNPETGRRFAWAYIDPADGVERRANWWSDGGSLPVNAKKKLKQEIPNLFWLELNGVAL